MQGLIHPARSGPAFLCERRLVAIGCRAAGDRSILGYLQSILPSLWLEHEKLPLHHQDKIPAVHHFQLFLH